MVSEAGVEFLGGGPAAAGGIQLPPAQDSAGGYHQLYSCLPCDKFIFEEK